MNGFLTMIDGDKTITFLFFALYLITAVRICRYSSWIDAGAPNPFLPKSVKQWLEPQESRLRAAVVA